MQEFTEQVGHAGAGRAPLSTGWRLVCVLISALAVGASTYPLGWWFLHPVAAVPLLVALPGARRPWLWLLLYSTVAEGVIFVWIQQTIALFSNIPGPLAWGILGLFGLVFGLPLALIGGLAHPLRRRLGDGWWVAWPAVWVLVEWAAQYVILFPYPQGATQHRALWLWQLASVTGAWGLSFLLGATSAVVAEPLLRWREGRRWSWRPVGVLVVVYAALATFGMWRMARVSALESESEVLRVGQVQSQHGMAWRRRHRAREAMGLWVDLTEDLEGEPIDLVIWPEGAVPYDLNASLVAPALWDLARAGGFDLVAGAGTRQRQPDPQLGEDRVRVFNSVYVFDRDRLKPRDPAGSPAQTWAELVAGGCDLDEAHLFTPWEVSALIEVGDEPGCLDALQRRMRRWATVQGLQRVLAEAEDRLPWPLLRELSAGFSSPLDSRRTHRDRRYVYHQLDEAGCTHGDCRYLLLRCASGSEAPCDVFPEAPHYDKMVPLPFGEYLPLREVFPWLGDLIRGPGNFRAGTEPLVFDVGGIRFGTPICYEGILSYVCTRFEDAELLINVTNDAWFGTGAASDLHGMLVVSRAMELGIPVVRSTYTGTSFVALPSGRVEHKTDLFLDVSRVVEVPKVRIPTLYAAWGDWFVGVCGLGLLVVGARSRRRVARGEVADG